MVYSSVSFLGLAKITTLSVHNDLAIQEKASRLLRRYFTQPPAGLDVLTDEDEDDTLSGDVQ